MQGSDINRYLLLQPLLVLASIFVLWNNESLLSYVDVTTTLQQVPENETNHLLPSATAARPHPTPSPCWRTCPSYPNLIVLEESRSRGAGLRDRTFVMKHMANIAGYLCARLVFQPPEIMLQEAHNGHKPIPKDLEWDDFWNVTYKADGSPVLMSKSDLQRILEERKNSFPIKMRTLKREDVPDTFQQMENITDRQLETTNFSSPFLWRIDNTLANFYTWKKLLAQRFHSREDGDIAKRRQLPYLKFDFDEGCSYFHLETPSMIRQVEDSVFDSVSVLPDADRAVQMMTVGHLHIRRGDATKFCDTSIEKIARFLTCSLKGLPNKTTTLLVGSDERDPCYRQAILSLIEGLGYGAMDLDQTIQRVVENKDLPSKYQINMFTFMIGESIRYDKSRVAFRLSQERHKELCTECTPIASKYPALVNATVVDDKKNVAVDVEMDETSVMSEFKNCRANNNIK